MSSTESVLGSASDLGDLPTSELLTHGHEALDWIARYLDHPERVVVSGLAKRLRPVTPWRRRWRLARYVALVALLPVAAQVVLFGLIWHHLARRP